VGILQVVPGVEMTLDYNPQDELPPKHPELVELLEKAIAEGKPSRHDDTPEVRRALYRLTKLAGERGYRIRRRHPEGEIWWWVEEK